ncbi:MAG: hypothetical protein K2P99_06585 [Burkholderiales bacterium]|nr:hypothetical protein [Burkholderiales bacterium]
MAEQIRDAVRHLEKDMADILEAMNDNSISEVILNPYKNSDGNYIGHILVDKHGIGITNLNKKLSNGRPSNEIVTMSATKAETIMSVLASITGKFYNVT